MSTATLPWLTISHRCLSSVAQQLWTLSFTSECDSDQLWCNSISNKTADEYAYRGSHCGKQVKRLVRSTEAPPGWVWKLLINKGRYRNAGAAKTIIDVCFTEFAIKTLAFCKVYHWFHFWFHLDSTSVQTSLFTSLLTNFSNSLAARFVPGISSPF